MYLELSQMMREQGSIGPAFSWSQEALRVLFFVGILIIIEFEIVQTLVLEYARTRRQHTKFLYMYFPF